MTDPTDAGAPDDLERSLGNAFKEIVAAADVMLSEFAAAETARLQGLVSAHDKLKASLGADHPRVQALAAAVTASQASRDRLARAKARRAKQPLPRANEWMVSGHVRNPAGEGQPGLRVRVFDKDRKLDDLLGDTQTDDDGDFTLVYHERDFAETNEGLPELYVQVENDAGAVIFSSQDKLRMQPGRVEFFDIALPATGGTAPAPSSGLRAARNPARAKRRKDEG